MVDRYGVPRVKCSCGNPLTEPTPLSSSLDVAAANGHVVFVGQPWTQWDPSIVIQVNATIEVNAFTVFDIDTNQTFTLAVGSDIDARTSSTTSTSTSTTTPAVGRAAVHPKQFGIEIVHADRANAEDFEWGEPFAEVRAALIAALGPPTKELPATPGPTACGYATTVWGELAIHDVNGTFGRWTLGGPNTGSPTFETDLGVAVGDSKEVIRKVYETQTLARDQNIGVLNRSNMLFDFGRNDGPTLITMSAIDRDQILGGDDIDCIR
jgi:hypothetical protein